jgi:hypothetical protein
MNETAVPANRWVDAWPDALAFVIGLGVAWGWGWNTTDLVWSLWLSSLVVGYAMILWRVTEPLRDAAQGIASDRTGAATGGKIVVLAVYGFGTLFGLVFFTVHFGGFHFGHSIFLGFFFPIEIDGQAASRGLPGVAVYLEVLRRYWWFLPAAVLAERAAFRTKPAGADDTAVTPDAIARRKDRGDAMMEPYKNVIRMHLLIFFFAFAHFARLESFAVYTVVYAVYFFPWRLLGGTKPAAG